MKSLKKAWIAAVILCAVFVKGSITSEAAVVPQEPDYTAVGLEYYIHSDQKTAAVKIQNKNTDVIIPETIKIQGKTYQVTEIKSSAIEHDSVVLGKRAKVARDDKEYFKNTKAKNVSIPKTITKIETGAFSYFTKLKKISVAKENAKYMSTTKGIFSKDGTTLILAVQGTGLYRVKNGVEKIAARAFAGTKYNRISLPDSCYKIGTRAFFNCNNLKKIQGGSLCICGNYAFFGTKVKNVDKYGTMRFKI